MTHWRLRTDTRTGDMAHGITFHMNETSGHNVRGEFSAGPYKFLIDGTASLTIAEGQHKYGDELIAQLYTRGTPDLKPRRADGYTRVQVYLGPANEATAQMLENMANTIRQIGATNDQNTL